jgi:hypothetical protein
MKMEATCSSETSVNFERSTRRYIPKDRTFHNHLCANLKSYMAPTVCILTLQQQCRRTFTHSNKLRAWEPTSIISAHASNLVSGLCVRTMERSNGTMDATALWEERWHIVTRALTLQSVWQSMQELHALDLQEIVAFDFATAIKLYIRTLTTESRVNTMCSKNYITCEGSQ